LKNLSKSFGGLKAVQNVGFDIREGMILGIIGPKRRRQDHAVQSAQRFYGPELGSKSCSTAAT